MCKVRDIILVSHYKDGDNIINRHSFIVLDDTNGTIEGLAYDLVCNVLSSFKTPEQKSRKLRYPGNFPISHNDTNTTPDNGKDGYIKADQLYYFNKSKIQFQVIGTILPDVLNSLLEFIEQSNFEIKNIIDNL